MKNWYFNLSIKYKLLLLFYFFLALFSTCFYLYNTRTASQNIMDKVGSANLYLLQQISSNVSFMRQEIEDMSTQLVIQPQIQAYIQPSEKQDDYVQKLYVDSNVRNAVNLIVSKDYISSLSICGFENNSVPFLRSIDSRFTLPPLQELSQMDFFQQAVDAKGKPIWLENSEETYVFAANNRYNRIFMARVIREYNTYENLGLLVIGISEPALRQAYTRGIDVDECAIAILDKNGELISSAGREAFSSLSPKLLSQIAQTREGYRTQTLEGQEMLLSYTLDKVTGWTYLYAVPMAPLTREINSSQNYILIFLLAAALLFFPLLMFATDMIIRPIRKLLGAMRSFQTGDFDARITFRYKDEIGQLGSGYNEMVDSIKRLIDQVYVLQIKEQEAEFTALQSQINPHFLYNTLDSIYWKATKNDQKEIAEMVWSLSNLFRISLNKGSRYNSVEHEFEFLKQYLRLQQLRYGDKINYEIQLDPNARTVEIPKLILQPFVENAIYHGLEQKDGQGTVTVSCQRTFDYLIFQIADNGNGMDNQTLTQLQSGAFTATKTSGYAIRNIQERLKLVYGEDYRLNILSSPGEGTTIQLYLPITHPKRREQDDKASDR
ncbi:sensor histidine kinase [Youxingia wuxianensis]|uniref:histidine kinase n=1 Tax=Youxingia wuxianensis TaxID=2763678 RepID=A0A926EPG9_9FIRM|nr:sensor histidine kinase [Youxingia wuxianensis]MBC8585366.1 sensor histidine kinase [Youxingia wuxianensis]